MAGRPKDLYRVISVIQFTADVWIGLMLMCIHYSRTVALLYGTVQLVLQYSTVLLYCTVQ